ncbi:hypothetical protein Tco_1277236 [Tanacetum coccineum]
MLLGTNLLLMLKVNATRHNLLLLVMVNVVEVDGKKIIITESIVRRDLQLEDAEGVDCLPNATIFEQLALIGAKTTAWNEFSSTMTSAIICFATNQKFTFSKYIFESMVKNLDNIGKFLMYPRRVKRLEKKKRSRTHRLKSLHKVSLSDRVESFGDEENLGEDASKQGRINAIDADEDITQVNDQDDANMFDVNTLTGDKVLAISEVAVKDVNLTKFDKEVRLAREKAKKEQEANVALTEEWDDIQAKIEADHELAQRLQAQEQEELSNVEKATLFVQLLEKRRKHFAEKRAEEKRNKPLTQKIFDRAFKRVNTFVDFSTDLVEGSSKREGTELEQESIKKQKVDEDKETVELQSLIKVIPDKEEVVIDVVPLASKPPTIVDWKIHKEGKQSYYQIIRVDGKSKMYRVFSQMLKSFSRKELEDLYKLVKATYGSTRLMEDLDLILYGDLKTIVNAAGTKLQLLKRLRLLEEFMLTEMRSKTYQRKDKD